MADVPVRLLLSIGVALAWVGAPSRAQAGAFEVQGLGPEGVAEASARSARAEDGTAAYFNPGGLALGQGTSIGVAPIVSVSTLEAQGERLPFEEPLGIAVSASGTVPLEGPLAGRIRLGFAGHFLPTRALRLLARAGDRAFQPYYDNRTQRLVVLPSLGVRITRHLGIGAAVNVLAGVRGPARLEAGATGAPEPRIDIDANTVMAGVFGVRFDPTEGARVALVVRQAFGIPMRIETTADVGGVPLVTNIETKRAMFDPLTVVLASSFDVGRASFEIDTAWHQWSAWEGPFLSVRSTLPGVNLGSRPIGRLFRDVVSLRIASSVRFDLGKQRTLVLRAGAGGEPTMMTSAPQGRTNLVDGDKLTVGLGATLVLTNVLAKALRIGLGGNGQFVSAAGSLFSTSLGVGVDL
ncbi:hypothetical protein [Polyangium sp. 15x6]|uniref:hypothetical protein n=1 Tax=Polyangium sp. 15x6 TaxID=3042687 RepID=UPI00249A5F74|nr:hypothetical protein [Polyangium sp. 15x6]MDI3288278.1 hypothetical protein [Polyangium sp. 15x6]